MWISYSHEPWNATLPLATGAKVVTSTTPPAAYIIPPAVDARHRRARCARRRHAAHHRRMDRQSRSAIAARGMEWQGPPFEGRHPVFAGEGAGAQPGRFGQCALTTKQ